MLVIRTQYSPPFSDESEAVAALAAASSVLCAASRRGLVWARCGHTLVPFDAGTIEALLSSERCSGSEASSRATHVLSLCSTPQGPGEIGVVVLNVRHGAVGEAAPGMVISVCLEADVFDTAADAVLRMAEAWLCATSSDVALIGPRDYLRELRVGWATFVRHVSRDLLPAGAEVVPARDGALVLAHHEDPASESPAARDAIAHVAVALRGEAPTAAAPPVPSTPATPAPPPAQPTYLAEPPRRHVPAALTSTAGLLNVPRGPALPFAQGTTAPLPAPRPRAPVELTGTLGVVDAARGPALPFTVADGPLLTLEQYAILRAQLAVKGEDDQETLRLFGITSRPIKEALQARFAERFRQAPAVQARFLELVRTLTAELRGQAPPR